MKKAIITAAAAVTATVTAASVMTTAVVKHPVQELRAMRDSLLGRKPVQEGQDINSDGAVDIFDYIRMRREFGSTGSFAVTSFKATEDNVKYTGRHLTDDSGVLWLVQSGSAAEFIVSARSASITLHGDKFIGSDRDHRSRYAVLVDGEIVIDATVDDKEKKVELFSGDESRIAEIKIIHLSEANNGAVGVGDIELDSDVPVPIAPAAKKPLNIEFIGDSITCAYGVEGASQNESFKTTTENFMKSYAYLTAKKLGADYSAVSYSGYGIVSGYTSDGQKADTMLVPAHYENVGSLKDYAKPWDFSSETYDAVVINLGTNDATYIDKDPENRAPEFIEKYEEFLRTVRRCNPDSYIICTLGIMGCTDEYPMIEQAVASYKEATGDERIMCCQSPTQSADDGYGSDWHPSEITQQKNAYIMADKICSVLGIESDQVGLDVAADAEYGVRYNDDSDANASTFFSDYDRSYWVNIVNGGSSEEDVIISVSGIGLKKGGKYRLTFKCASSKGEGDKTTDHKVVVQSTDGRTVYLSDVFENTGEKAPFEAEFTADSSGSAEIVIFAGGVNYRSLTLYDLRLEKIA